MRFASPMEAMCFPLYKRAAAAMATFELRVRLLADAADEGTPLQKAALGTDLSVLLEMVCVAYKATEEETARLKAVAGIRNKLFHLELSRVTGRIRPLVEQLREGGTWMADLTTGEVAQVAKTKTQCGRIYGWMWESAESGAFEAVAAVALEAVGTLDALRDRSITETIENSRST